MIETFDQTLSLYDEARLDEVVSGCELILQMDDRFEPATRLRDKARDPSADVDLSDLAQYRGLVIEEASPVAEPDSESGGAAGGASVSDARTAMASGDYQTAVDICNAVLAANPNDTEAQQLGAEALEKVEAAPFVAQFVDEANQAVDAGNSAAAQVAIDKARSLVGKHPDIDAAEARLLSMGDSPAATTDPGPPAAAPESPPVADEASAFDFGSTDSGFSFDEEPAGETADPGEASSLGFTMEDAPAADSSFEVGGADGIDGSGFDFSVGEVAVSEDDQSSIEKYLAEGDELFDGGNYTGAIDAWSKIFLIDVTNDEANARIEKAKERKRELESKLDEVLQSGIAAFDRQDYTTAEQAFEEVLAGDPDNYQAQEYLEKLRDHQAATGGAVPPPPPGAEGVDAADMYGAPADLYDEPVDGLYGDASADATAPPPPPKAAPGPAPVADSSGGKLKPLLIGLILLALVGGGGYLVYSMFFEDAPPVDAPDAFAETEGKINRARIATEEGNFSEAERLLSSIAASDPRHSEAVQLLADVRRRSQMAVDQENEQRFNTLVEQGRTAMAEEDWPLASSSFQEASEIKALTPEDQQSLAIARRELSELSAATALLEQGNYSEAAANLEAILAREPDNVAARRLMGYAWYNQGVQSLRDTGNSQRARDQFSTALEYIPQDTMARRNIEFIDKYENQPADLQYQIYVKYLEYR